MSVRWSRDEGNWTAVPNALLRDPSLSAGAVRLWVLLRSYDWQDEGCFVGQDTLCAQAGVSRRTLFAYQRELEAAGYLRIIRQGLQRPNLYELGVPDRKQPSDPDGSSTAHQDGQPTAQPDGSPTTHEEDAEEEDTEKKKKRSPLIDEWNEWLADYREVTGRASVRGSRSARSAFCARRRDGYSLADLKRATRGCHGDDFCRRNGHDVPGTILRPSKVDRYITLAKDDPASDDDDNARAIRELRARGMDDEADELERAA